MEISDDLSRISVREREMYRDRGFFIGIMCVVTVVFIVAYIMGAFYYNTHFFPGTVINGLGCSNSDKPTVMSRLILQSQNYQLEVTGRNLQREKVELITITAKDVGLVSAVDEEEINQLLSSQNNWFWISFLWSSGYNYTLKSNADFDVEAMKEVLNEQSVFQTKKMTASKNAAITGYSEEEQQYILTPEIYGTQLDMAKVYNVLEDAFIRRLKSIDLEERGCYINPTVTANDADLKGNIAQANKWLEAEIQYDWNGKKVTIDKEQLKEWVLLRNGTLSLDKSAIAQFVTEHAQENDTYRKPRSFHTILGYDLSLPCGDFGWLTDTEAEADALIELIQAGTVCEREPVYTSKGPVKGTNDIGNSYVEADMTHQHLYLFKNGQIVLETDFVSGDMSNGSATPEGVFGITYKTTNATLRGADYETPVNYWMPFQGNYGMHDATWREEFGGDIYLTDGSHGCLNLPLDKAAEIYSYMTEGFPVICYYYPEGMLSQPEEEQPAQEQPAEWQEPDDDD